MPSSSVIWRTASSALSQQQHRRLSDHLLSRKSGRRAVQTLLLQSAINCSHGIVCQQYQIWLSWMRITLCCLSRLGVIGAQQFSGFHLRGRCKVAKYHRGLAWVAYSGAAAIAQGLFAGAVQPGLNSSLLNVSKMGPSNAGAQCLPKLQNFQVCTRSCQAVRLADLMLQPLLLC